jgi:hypothetical protein
MTFDQWIDDVNAQVHARLGSAVKTEELSWDSAIWRTAAATAVASVADDGLTARLSFDGGDRLAIAIDSPEAGPSTVGRTIAEHLTAR